MDALALAGAQTTASGSCCPSCGGSSIEPFYSVRSVPLHSCVLLDTPEAARAFPKRDLELAFCPECGFAFNAIFDEAAMAYSAIFEESQHFSGTFDSFARGLASEIAVACDAAGKRIVEIGCGKGEFLARLCDVAGASGVGIDPAFRADPGRTTSANSLRFIPQRFGPAHFGLHADIVVCRHTLEHIAQVRAFLGDIRRLIGPRQDVWVVFETPDAARVMREGAFWDIYYEHCSYLSAGTHADLFAREGFEVTEVKLLYGGQYIVQYARPSAARPASPTHPGQRAVEEMRGLVRAFPERVRRSQRHWRDRIVQAHAAGRNVALWGGGSKAVSLLTTLGLGEEVAAVVDINPYKQGKFLPGTGHPVIVPEDLARHEPGLVVVMNPVYLDEISRRLAELGVGADVAALA